MTECIVNAVVRDESDNAWRIRIRISDSSGKWPNDTFTDELFIMARVKARSDAIFIMGMEFAGRVSGVMGRDWEMSQDVSVQMCADGPVLCVCVFPSPPRPPARLSREQIAELAGVRPFP